MSAVNSGGARIALVTGHMAGMIDQPALPVWVGTLIAGYAFAPAQAAERQEGSQGCGRNQVRHASAGCDAGSS